MHLLCFALFSITIDALPTSRADFTTLGHSTNPSWNPSNGTASIQGRRCGVNTPGLALMQTHKKLRAAFRTRAAPSNLQRYTIDTAFHVVTTQSQKGTITREMVSDQIDVLQAAYASSNIIFRLISMDYTANDSWATNEKGSEMKAALRKGNYSTLNIYFQTDLSAGHDDGQSSRLLGHCTLPTTVTYSPCNGCPLAVFPKENYIEDGCNVHAGSMPGNYLQSYNQGKTAVHEVGHWLGLLHTFQGNSCDLTNQGDMIDDTPRQSKETEGCPIGKNTCSDSPGLDPIHNFMDYSSDPCYESFTPQQIYRMSEVFRTMRLGY